MRANRTAVAAMMILATALVSGCRIESNKHGDNDNVKIATPFGGMSVKTNDAAVMDGLGLPVYPGAELVKKDKNNGAADVNMSFGSFSTAGEGGELPDAGQPGPGDGILSQGIGAVWGRDSMPEQQSDGHADAYDGRSGL